jgi:thiol:disulfide interchange protein DsbD
MKKIVILLLLIQPILGISQMLDPTKWTLSISKKEVKVNETVEITLTATIDNGWKLYGLGENPPQASFTVEGTGFKEVGKMKEGAGIHKGYDDILEMNVSYFEGKAVFKQTVKILKANPVINIELEGQACPKGPGQCVRVNKSFKVNDIKVIASSEPSNTKEEAKEKPVKEGNKDTKQSSNSKESGLAGVRALEEEREKLITKDENGKDQTIEYLKEFVTKYGSKK